MDIITKFIIATDEVIEILLKLIKELTEEKFASILEPSVIEEYFNKYFNRKYLISEMNSMSNQWLMVYADHIPVGYAKITSNGKVPNIFEEKRALRIADFSILKKFSDQEIKNSLYEKCISVCKYVDGIWLNEYLENPMIDFFESKGFERLSHAYMFDEIGIPSACLVYYLRRNDKINLS